MGVQEVKAQAADVLGRFDRACRLRRHFHYAEKKGYSGVGLYTKAPSAVITGFGPPSSIRGRYVEGRWDTHQAIQRHQLPPLPSGSSGEDRQVGLPARHLSCT